MIGRCKKLVMLSVLVGLWMGVAVPWADAKDPSPRMSIDTKKPFDAFTQDLKASIRKNKMGLVAHANAQAGAASRGVKIPGNQVFMIYRPDFAIRMLEADVAAGFEAPIRIYVTEKPDGMAQVSYIKPSDVFAGYKNVKLNEMGKELDAIFAAIIRDAL